VKTKYKTKIQNFKSLSKLAIEVLLLLFLGVLQLMVPEAPQPYGLLYYPRIGLYNFLHQFRSATPPEQRKLEL
jgi:hypothetical protein